MLQSLDLEWCIPAPSSNPSTNAAVDLDNITLPSFNMASPQTQTQPGAPSVAPPAVTQGHSPQIVEVQDDLTMASMVDSRLSVLEETCALLPLIMEKIEGPFSSTPPLLMGLPQP